MANVDARPRLLCAARPRRSTVAPEAPPPALSELRPLRLVSRLSRDERLGQPSEDGYCCPWSASGPETTMRWHERARLGPHRHGAVALHGAAPRPLLRRDHRRAHRRRLRRRGHGVRAAHPGCAARQPSWLRRGLVAPPGLGRRSRRRVLVGPASRERQRRIGYVHGILVAVQSEERLTPADLPPLPRHGGG